MAPPNHQRTHLTIIKEICIQYKPLTHTADIVKSVNPTSVTDPSVYIPWVFFKYLFLLDCVFPSTLALSIIQFLPDLHIYDWLCIYLNCWLCMCAINRSPCVIPLKSTALIFHGIQTAGLWWHACKAPMDICILWPLRSYWKQNVRPG